ncbi:hypothetical protein ACFO9Q_07090 [Paenibacillus sp. GCM10023252]|uniref:hypothetical protein n=1 Tax=Paenibacillus sp. GCM10023252 TaxID=3252649 RepID=UPI003610A7F4
MKSRAWLSILSAITLVTLATIQGATASEMEYMKVQQTEAVFTGYLHNVEWAEGTWVAKLNEIEWYEGEAAKAKFEEQEGQSGEEGPPDGYYIIDSDSSITSLPIATDAVVLMQIYNRTGKAEEADIIWNEQIGLKEFITLIEENEDWSMRDYPYHCTVQDGKIIRIVQQYIP